MSKQRSSISLLSVAALVTAVFLAGCSSIMSNGKLPNSQTKSESQVTPAGQTKPAAGPIMHAEVGPPSWPVDKNPNGLPSRVPEYNPQVQMPYPHYPAADPKTYKFLNVEVSLPVPQAYYMFDKGLLANAMKSTGFKAAELPDDVHQKVLPNLYNGYYDFAYLPVNVLAEYWSGRVLCAPQLWRGGDDYVVIAGAYDGGVSLLTAPDIFDLKTLDGKTVGVMNPSFNLEMQLNQTLHENGLATRSAGGTVNVVHNFPGNIMNDLLAKKISAVFAWDMYKPQLKELGFQEVRTWNQLGYGDKSPYMVLVVRKDILAKHPEVVQAVLKAHVQASRLANKGSDYAAPLIAKYNLYATGLKRKARPAASFNYANLRVTTDPNVQYLKDTLNYMESAKILKRPVNFSDLVKLTLLNKAEK